MASNNPFERIRNGLNNVVQNVQKFAQQSMLESYDEIKVLLDEAYNRGVQKFYDQYDPDFYDRNNQLLQSENAGVFTVEKGDETMFVEIHDEAMSVGRNGYNLFQKVFMEGWHGGARPGGSGTPRYRKYPPEVIRDNPSIAARVHGRPWTMWGMYAEQGTAPFDLYHEEKQIAEQQIGKLVTEKLLAGINSGKYELF